MLNWLNVKKNRNVYFLLVILEMKKMKSMKQAWTHIGKWVSTYNCHCPQAVRCSNDRMLLCFPGAETGRLDTDGCVDALKR